MGNRRSAESLAARRGRAIGIGAYSVFMTGVAILWGGQVMDQVWFPARDANGSCRDSVRKLRVALNEAAARGRQQPREAEALRVFRARIEAPWRSRPGLDDVCRDVAGGKAALSALDRLRYDEEAALRLTDGSGARQNAVLDRLTSSE